MTKHFIKDLKTIKPFKVFIMSFLFLIPLYISYIHLFEYEKACSLYSLTSKFIILFLFYIYLKRKDVSIESFLGYRQVTLNAVKSVVFKTLRVCFSLQIISYLFINYFKLDIFTGYLLSYPEDTPQENLFIINTLIFVIGIPCFEELFFNGYLLNKNIEKSGEVNAFLFTGILFGLLHPGIYKWIFIFSGSAFLFLYIHLKFKSLILSFISHALFNLIGVIWSYWLDDAFQTLSNISILLLIVTTILCYFNIKMFWKFYKGLSDENEESIYTRNLKDMGLYEEKPEEEIKTVETKEI